MRGVRLVIMGHLDPEAEACDERLNLSVGVHCSVFALFDVQNFPTQWQDCLEDNSTHVCCSPDHHPPRPSPSHPSSPAPCQETAATSYLEITLPALFCGPSSTVPLYDENFRLRRHTIARRGGADEECMVGNREHGGRGYLCKKRSANERDSNGRQVVGGRFDWMGCSFYACSSNLQACPATLTNRERFCAVQDRVPPWPPLLLLRLTSPSRRSLRAPLSVRRSK